MISGSIFGDNLAPISDTTIASSQTQGVTVQEAVRTRLPYSMTVGIISGILYIVIGLSQSAGEARPSRRIPPPPSPWCSCWSLWSWSC